MAAFNGCTALTDVFFEGTEAKWNAISISPLLNDSLLGAKLHYNYNGVRIGSAQVSPNGNGTTTFTFSIAYSGSSGAVACGAQYSPDGRFLNMAMLHLDSNKDNSLVITAKNGNTIHVFVIDDTDYSPLCEMQEVFA